MGIALSCFFSSEEYRGKPDSSTVAPSSVASTHTPGRHSYLAPKRKLHPESQQHSQATKETGIVPVNPTFTEDYLSGFWNEFVEGRKPGNGVAMPRAPISDGRWDHTAPRKSARHTQISGVLQTTDQEVFRIPPAADAPPSSISTELSSIHSTPQQAPLTVNTSAPASQPAANGKMKRQPVVFQNPSYEWGGHDSERFHLPKPKLTSTRPQPSESSPFIWDSREDFLLATQQPFWSDWQELQVAQEPFQGQHRAAEPVEKLLEQSDASSYRSEEDLLGSTHSRAKLLTRQYSSTHPPEDEPPDKMIPLRRMDHTAPANVQPQLNDYELLGPLSNHGNTALDTLTGSTKLMRHRVAGELVAAKFIHLKDQGVMHKYAEREVVNHRQLVHTNIVRVKNVFLTADRSALTIITEYATCGNLGTRLARQKRLSEAETRRLFQQLVSGLMYCHSKAIYHRDLHLECLLLDGEEDRPTLKIGGFSRSKSGRMDSGLKTQVTKAIWTAPELLMGSYKAGGEASYEGEPLDVWGCGLILWACLWGGSPFQNQRTSALEAMSRIAKAQFVVPQEPQVSESAKDLVRRILVANHEQRITLADIARHPWLREETQQAGRQDIQISRVSMDLATMEAVSRSRQRRHFARQLHHGLPDY